MTVTHPRRFALAAVVLAISIGLVGACTSAASPETPSVGRSPATSHPTPVAKPPPATASPARSSSPASTPPTTTSLAWGRIWDALPPSFPKPPGAEPTETGESGASSATLAIPSAPSAAADWYSTALPAAGYSVEGATAPLENGGYVLDALGSKPDCRVQVTLAKAGEATTATILFGAACPFS